MSKLAAVGALQEFAGKLAALQARHDLAAAEDRADSARALVASRERVLQTALAAAKLQC